MLAKHALYQLSYGPPALLRSAPLSQVGTNGAPFEGRQGVKMVGPGRFELPTSRLSGVRSNQLSYGPSEARAA